LSAGLCPEPLGELTALPSPLAGFKGSTSKEREGRGWLGRRGDERGGEGKEGEGRRSGLPPTHNFWLRHCWLAIHPQGSFQAGDKCALRVE